MFVKISNEITLRLVSATVSRKITLFLSVAFCLEIINYGQFLVTENEECNAELCRTNSVLIDYIKFLLEAKQNVARNLFHLLRLLTRKRPDTNTMW